MSAILKDILVIPAVWSLFSHILVYSPSTPFPALIDYVSTIVKKKQAWAKDPTTCDHFRILLALSKTSPKVFGFA